MSDNNNQNIASIIVNGENVFLYQKYDPINKRFTTWELFIDGIKQERVRSINLHIGMDGNVSNQIEIYHH